VTREAHQSIRGPFLATLSIAGEALEAPIADFPASALGCCEPVRRPPAYTGQRHMPGRWFSTTTAGFLRYESLLERDWLLLMDFDPEVSWMREQPLRLSFRRDGRPANHVPDLLVLRGGERPLLCDVKSEPRLDDPRFVAQRRACELACAEVGWEYRVLSEPDPQLLVNVRWLAGFRERPPDLDAERRRMLYSLDGGGQAIGELVAQATEPLLARPVLMNAIWEGAARVELSRPLAEASLVRRAAGGDGA